MLLCALMSILKMKRRRRQRHSYNSYDFKHYKHTFVAIPKHMLNEIDILALSLYKPKCTLAIKNEPETAFFYFFPFFWCIICFQAVCFFRSFHSMWNIIAIHEEQKSVFFSFYLNNTYAYGFFFLYPFSSLKTTGKKSCIEWDLTLTCDLIVGKNAIWTNEKK